MYTSKQKRKFAILNTEETKENDEKEKDTEIINTFQTNEFTGFLEAVENTNSLNTINNDSHLSNNLAGLDDALNSLSNEGESLVNSLPAKRIRTSSGPEMNDWSHEMPLHAFDFPLYLQSVTNFSAWGSDSLENDHSSSTEGLTDFSTSTSFSDSSLEGHSSNETLHVEAAEIQVEVPEVIDLSSPVLQRGSSNIVDLTVDTPTGKDVVDLTRETVDHGGCDSSPIIVSVNKIFHRTADVQWPSCRFQKTPENIEQQPSGHTENSAEQLGTKDSTLGDKQNQQELPLVKSIVCPICLENGQSLSKRKKQLSSTICGHVFCSKCIKSAVQCQKKCPTCRKKLSLGQIHPLFL